MIQRLTPRDRWILAMVHEHRVLTAPQLTSLAFTGARSAQRRLRTLHDLDVLDSFRPLVTRGSAPQHYTLGRNGAAILAAEAGRELASTGWRGSATARVAYSPQLAHDVAVNELFTRLATRPGQDDGDGLTLWLSARSAARRWGDLVHPDGYAHWTTEQTVLPFFIEHDTGSENLARLEARLDTYAAFAVNTTTRPALLIHTSTAAREHAMRRRLVEPAQAHGLPVATASADCTSQEPWARWWTPLLPSGRRTTLDALASCWTGLSYAPGLAGNDTDDDWEEACDGLVVAAFGVGHVPAVLVERLENLAARIPVVLASRIGSGPVLRATYSFPGSEKDLQDRGLISAGHLGPYQARILLHEMLRRGADHKAVRAAFIATAH